MWYGLKIGLSFSETMTMPIGYLLDLIAIEQVKNEGAALKKSEDEEADEFMRLLEYR